MQYMLSLSIVLGLCAVSFAGPDAPFPFSPAGSKDELDLPTRNNEAEEADRTDPPTVSAKPESDGSEKLHPVLPDDGDVTLPKRRSYVKPDYPEVAQVAHLEGRVTLQAVIDKKGNVRKSEVLGCSAWVKQREAVDSTVCELFSRAAIEAVSTWRYRPARKNGKPVDVYFTIRVDFELE